MKHEYRGQLTKGGKVLDIISIDIEKALAICDHGDGNIPIDEFNCIFCPTEKFKELVGVKTDVVIEDELMPQKTKKTSK